MINESDAKQTQINFHIPFSEKKPHFICKIKFNKEENISEIDFALFLWISLFSPMVPFYEHIKREKYDVLYMTTMIDRELVMQQSC